MHPSPPLQLSSSMLAEEEQLEKQQEAQRLLAGALASQVFGGLLLPESPADAWVLEGLAGHLAGVYLRQLLGPAELALARHQERQALVAGDDGRLAPLCAQPHRLRVGSALYGSTYGTEVGGRQALARGCGSRAAAALLLAACACKLAAGGMCMQAGRWCMCVQAGRWCMCVQAGRWCMCVQAGRWCMCGLRVWLGSHGADPCLAVMALIPAWQSWR
jgi:hypothetical protein